MSSYNLSGVRFLRCKVVITSLFRCRAVGAVPHKIAPVLHHISPYDNQHTTLRVETAGLIVRLFRVSLGGEGS